MNCGFLKSWCGLVMMSMGTPTHQPSRQKAEDNPAVPAKSSQNTFPGALRTAWATFDHSSGHEGKATDEAAETLDGDACPWQTCKAPTTSDDALAAQGRQNLPAVLPDAALVRPATPCSTPPKLKPYLSITIA